MRDRIRFILVEVAIKLLMQKHIATFVYLLHYIFLLFKNETYYNYELYMKYVRVLSLVSDGGSNVLEGKFIVLLKNKIISDKYYVLNLFLKSSEAKQIYLEFKNYGANCQARIKFPKNNDDANRQGDLVVLKPYIDKTEKGVLLIQYNDSIKRFVAIYDLEKIAKYYIIILEPSTWGYQYLEFLNYYNLGTDIIIEAQRKEDFDYIKKLGSNFIAIRVGAGDWVNPDMFNQVNVTQRKKYDLIMIASWQCLKRHDLLLSELAKIKNKISKIALVGYPIGGRTIKDIIKKCNYYGIYELVDLFEEIPNDKVGELLCSSKISVMLSKREGANKAIYESFFSNVPIIVSKCNVGINRDHINNETGMFVDDKCLHEAILYMKENDSRFSPRQWALKNTGCYNTTNTINHLLIQLSVENGAKWSQDIFQRKGGGKHVQFNNEYYEIANKEFEFLGNNFLRTDIEIGRQS